MFFILMYAPRPPPHTSAPTPLTPPPTAPK